MGYRLVFTPRANKLYAKCLNYFVAELENGQAAERVLKDIEDTLDRIYYNANSYALSENRKLAKRGIHKVHLKHYPYKIFYKVIGNVIFIEAIIHDKQDFENILK